MAEIEVREWSLKALLAALWLWSNAVSHKAIATNTGMYKFTNVRIRIRTRSRLRGEVRLASSGEASTGERQRNPESWSNTSTTTARVSVNGCLKTILPLPARRPGKQAMTKAWSISGTHAGVTLQQPKTPAPHPLVLNRQRAFLQYRGGVKGMFLKFQSCLQTASGFRLTETGSVG